MRDGSRSVGSTRRRALAAALLPLCAVVALTVHAAASTPPLFADGFENGTGAWTKTVGLTIEGSTVHGGSFAAEARATGGGKTYATTTLSSTQVDLFARVWFLETSRTSKTTLIRFRTSSNGQIASVGTTATGAIYLLDSVTGVTTTSPVKVPLGAWHLLQLHGCVTCAAGHTDVWLDGSVIAQLSGDRNLGTTAVGRVEVGESAASRTYDVFLDDVAVARSYVGPSTPAVPTATAISAGQVDVTWAPNPPADGPVSYDVYRALDPSGTPALVGSSATSTFSDTSVQPSTTYVYSVVAADPSGVRSDASPQSATVTTPAASGLPPQQPTGLAASSVASDHVDLTWDRNPPADGVSSYTVYRTDDPSVTPVQIGTSSVPSFRDGSVLRGTSYWYAIDAVNVSGSSPPTPLLRVDVPDADPTIAAAGDIACDPADPGIGATDTCRSAATGAQLAQGGYDAILPLGDTQYGCGGLSAFGQVYDPSWGGSRLAITMPVVGNHEYLSGTASGTGCSSTHDAAGFFAYFATTPALSGNWGVQGSPAKGWYSYDIGAWHLIALNAECGYLHGCGSGTPQEVWLRQDLAAHPTACTLAYWHQPRWADGNHASDTSYDTFWRDLYAAGADVVLNGHVHAYERYTPVDPTGAPDPLGIREFIVGTGGEGFGGIGTGLPTLEVAGASTFGILELTLHPDGYDWHFAPAPASGNGTFTDAGTAQCHGAP